MRVLERAPYADAQLVQLRETEFVSAVDQDGVGCGDIDPGLDDVRAEEQVMPLLEKFAHHALQVALAHLAVRHRDARLGQELLELLAHDLYGGDVVVQEKDLAAALQLSQRRLADDAARIRRDEGADRE